MVTDILYKLLEAILLADLLEDRLVEAVKGLGKELGVLATPVDGPTVVKEVLPVAFLVCLGACICEREDDFFDSLDRF